MPEKIKMSSRALALDAQGSRRRIDENGYLHVSQTHLTKEQVVPYYGKEIPGWEEHGLEPERVYYGYRPADEIEKASDMFNGMPLLVIHQQDSAHAPLKEVRVGSIGTTPVWDAPYLDNSITVTDQSAIDAINDESLREISCAYFYDPDFTPGEFNGARYDFVMRNIRGNHVALVRDGRAGPDVCVHDAMPSKLKKVLKPMKLTRTQVAVRAALASTLKPLLAQDAAPADLTKLVGSYKKPQSLAKAVERKYSTQLAQDAELDAEELAEVIEAAVEVAESDPAEDEGDKDENDPAFDEDEPAESLRKLLEGKVPDELLEQLIASLTPAADEGSAPDAGVPAELADKDTNSDSEPDKKGPAMDANAIKTQARTEAQAHFRNLNEAGRKVKALVGEVDVMAFDSAEDIYAHALKRSGVKVSQYDKAAYKGMVDMLAASKPNQLANDAAINADPVEFEGAFAHLKNINIG